jgi:hypothetical protein
MQNTLWREQSCAFQNQPWKNVMYEIIYEVQELCGARTLTKYQRK